MEKERLRKQFLRLLKKEGQNLTAKEIEKRWEIDNIILGINN